METPSWVNKYVLLNELGFSVSSLPFVVTYLHVFLFLQMSSQKDYSMATADIVDAEVRELVEKAYKRATDIITTHIDILHKLAQLLIEKETVDGEEFMSLFIDGQAELYVS